MTGLIVALVIVSYSVGAGLMAAYGHKRNWKWDDVGPVLAVICWPIVLPGAMTFLSLQVFGAWRKRRADAKRNTNIARARVVKEKSK